MHLGGPSALLQTERSGRLEVPRGRPNASTGAGTPAPDAWTETPATLANFFFFWVGGSFYLQIALLMTSREADRPQKDSAPFTDAVSRRGRRRRLEPLRDASFAGAARARPALGP